MMTYRCYTNSMLERISIIICKMSKRLEIVRYPINKKTPEFVKYEFFFQTLILTLLFFYKISTSSLASSSVTKTRKNI